MHGVTVVLQYTAFQGSRMTVLVIQQPRLRPTSFCRITKANLQSFSVLFVLTLISTVTLPSPLSLLSPMA